MPHLILLRHGQSTWNRLIVAHGNSLRGLVKFLDDIPDGSARPWPIGQ